MQCWRARPGRAALVPLSASGLLLRGLGRRWAQASGVLAPGVLASWCPGLASWRPGIPAALRVPPATRQLGGLRLHLPSGTPTISVGRPKPFLHHTCQAAIRARRQISRPTPARGGTSGRSGPPTWPHGDARAMCPGSLAGQKFYSGPRRVAGARDTWTPGRHTPAGVRGAQAAAAGTRRRRAVAGSAGSARRPDAYPQRGTRPARLGHRLLSLWPLGAAHGAQLTCGEPWSRGGRAAGERGGNRAP